MVRPRVWMEERSPLRRVAVNILNGPGLSNVFEGKWWNFVVWRNYFTCPREFWRAE